MIVNVWYIKCVYFTCEVTKESLKGLNVLLVLKSCKNSEEQEIVRGDIKEICGNRNSLVMIR